MVYRYFGIIVYAGNVTPQERYLTQMQSMTLHQKMQGMYVTVDDIQVLPWVGTHTHMYLYLHIMCTRKYNRLLQIKKCSSTNNVYVQPRNRIHVPFPIYVSQYTSVTQKQQRKLYYICIRFSNNVVVVVVTHMGMAVYCYVTGLMLPTNNAM